MCGNGIRCMARFLLEVEGKDPDTEKTYTISTNAGKIVPKLSKDGLITVDMGQPILEAAKVPTTILPTKDGAVVEADIEACGTTYKVNCVSMGNPHAVLIYIALSMLTHI